MLPKVIVIGHLTRDIELRYTPSGTPIGSTAIAASERYKAQDGTQKENTCFVDLTLINVNLRQRRLGSACLRGGLLWRGIALGGLTRRLAIQHLHLLHFHGVLASFGSVLGGPLLLLEAAFDQDFGAFVEILVGDLGGAAPEGEVHEAGVLFLSAVMGFVSFAGGDGGVSDWGSAGCVAELDVAGEVADCYDFRQHCFLLFQGTPQEALSIPAALCCFQYGTAQTA